MKLIIKLIFVFIIPNAIACPLLENPQNLSTSFKQTRRIAGIKMPIVSTGNFSLEIGKQIVWETIQPFYSKVVISEEGFRVQDELYSAGPMRQLSSVLLQLHSGKIDQEKFKHECKMQDDKKYHFKASPKDSNLSKVFKEIEIIGANQPEVINYIDSRDDKTQVEFIK